MTDHDVPDLRGIPDRQGTVRSWPAPTLSAGRRRRRRCPGRRNAEEAEQVDAVTSSSTPTKNEDHHGRSSRSKGSSDREGAALRQRTRRRGEPGGGMVPLVDEGRRGGGAQLGGPSGVQGSPPSWRKHATRASHRSDRGRPRSGRHRPCPPPPAAGQAVQRRWGADSSQVSTPDPGRGRARGSRTFPSLQERPGRLPPPRTRLPRR